ncbi:hypothetical protein [Sphingomonas sp.]|jgi:hypothetical protein|uniref:hypothetical protein n=1 Tax=Sphingomonas sp. TaxID=28214 RepID=UPI002E328389|nr:hypothetical protein [Sphingomonas sp.]HEX4694307.1 hypothetical protein [Sphingomonas sp.]
MRVLSALAVLALAISSPALADTLTNSSIIALATAGLDPDAIIAKIQSSDTNFDLSTAQLIMLKKRGVPSSVIAAMLAADGRKRGGSSAAPDARAPARSTAAGVRPPAARPPGIYLMRAGELVRIEANVSGQTKTGGFLGSALSYGIAKISTKVVLQGESARVQTSEPSPTFFFYLPPRASASSFDEPTGTPDSPSQFSLIRLQRKDGSREARIGRGNITGFQSGVVSKDRVDFTFDEDRPGVFSVRPSSPLPAGEYSFIMIGSGGASVARFFDFSVR